MRHSALTNVGAPGSDHLVLNEYQKRGYFLIAGPRINSPHFVQEINGHGVRNADGWPGFDQSSRIFIHINLVWSDALLQSDQSGIVKVGLEFRQKGLASCLGGSLFFCMTSECVGPTATSRAATKRNFFITRFRSQSRRHGRRRSEIIFGFPIGLTGVVRGEARLEPNTAAPRISCAIVSGSEQFGLMAYAVGIRTGLPAARGHAHSCFGPRSPSPIRLPSKVKAACGPHCEGIGRMMK